MTKLGDLFPNELYPHPKPANTPMPVTRPVPPRSTGPGPAPIRDGAVADSQKRRPQAPPIKRFFVQDFVTGQEVEGIFLVAEATLRVGKNGAKYIQASLCDKTGSVPARQWDATDNDFECYKISGYVKVRGRAETYKNAMQLIVSAVQIWNAADVNTAEFLPVSTRPFEEMEKELNLLLESFTDPDYKALLNGIFGDADIRARFLKGPAAAAIHHAWLGGLCEHVLSACKTAQAIAETRPYLNRDLLLTGVILHDIGKIEEISSGPGFSYTDSGRLCGHIVLGTLLVERQILKLPEFPRRKRDLILHMILSHHGELEYGSPVTPMTAEAVALHHLECLDAKVQGIQTLIEKDRAAGNEGMWTEFARVVDGRIFKGS